MNVSYVYAALLVLCKTAVRILVGLAQSWWDQHKISTIFMLPGHVLLDPFVAACHRSTLD